MKRKITYPIALLALICAVALPGCGNDAKVESRDKTGAVKYNMPDQFDTIAAKCDGHGHRIFEASSGGLAVIADQACQGHTGP
jgi:hypothetical protein